MKQLNLHSKNVADKVTPPPSRNHLPIIQHLINAYKLWHTFVPHLPKDNRYTLGKKFDSLFVETIEAVYIGSYVSKKEKAPFIRKAIGKLDVAKFFLQIAWEIKALDTKKYATISAPLNEIGKMLGGWLKFVEQNSRW